MIFPIKATLLILLFYFVEVESENTINNKNLSVESKY